MSRTETPSRTAVTIASSVGVLIGVVVAVATSDVILGVIAGASFIAIIVGLLRLWYGDGGAKRPRHL